MDDFDFKRYMKMLMYPRLYESESLSSNSGQLALFIDMNKGGNERHACVYDPSSLRKLISDMVESESSEEDKGDAMAVLSRLQDEDDYRITSAIIHQCIRGSITVGKVDRRSYGPCAGAWMVKYSAGIGMGDVLYPIGFFIAQEKSASKRLVSDREAVSRGARSRWTKISATNRERVQLDDKNLPRKNRRTPDDPSDDCVLHPASRDFLNYAYSPDGSEASMVATMRTVHDTTMSEMAAELRIKASKFNTFKKFMESQLNYCAMRYFNSVVGN